MIALTVGQLGHMVEVLTRAATSTRATLAEGAAAVAVCEAFSAGFRGLQVELEHVEKRARQIIEGEDGDEAGLRVLALHAEGFVRAAAEAAQRVHS